MTKSQLTDKQLKDFINSGGRKGAKADFDKVLKKVANVNKNVDKQ